MVFSQPKYRFKPLVYPLKPIPEEELEGLDTELAGYKMRTPFGVGAIGAIERNGFQSSDELANLYLKHLEAGGGHINLCSLMYFSSEAEAELLSKARKKDWEVLWRKLGKPMPTPFVYGYDWTTPWGFLAISMATGGKDMHIINDGRHGEELLKAQERIVDIIKDRRPDNAPIIANVQGYGGIPEGYVPSAKAAEEIGVEIIELNLACPIPAGLVGAVDFYLEEDWPACGPGQYTALMKSGIGDKIVEAVVRAVNIPVGVKLSPEITGFPFCVELAKRFQKAGAKFITTLNNGVTIIPPDIFNRGRPRLKNVDLNTFCGLSGPNLLLENYKVTAALVRHVPGMEVMSVGGISTPENVVEMLMLGARTTEQVTQVKLRGLQTLRDNVRFFRWFLEDQGYSCVEDFIGIHQQYIGGIEEMCGLDDVTYVGVTDPYKCVGCGICCDMPDKICRILKNGKVVVAIDRCNGCGVCAICCPVGACMMKPVKGRTRPSAFSLGTS
jgi:dihydroorotate dehydrogenase/Pyruvate/2-oxoacid:ferredoxin oxidoreductase delta subunit